MGLSSQKIARLILSPPCRGCGGGLVLLEMAVLVLLAAPTILGVVAAQLGAGGDGLATQWLYLPLDKVLPQPLHKILAPHCPGRHVKN